MKVLFSVAKKLLLVAVIFIFIAAFFVCLSWVVSPILHKHRAGIETWLGDLLGLPVEIQKVDLSWYRYQPVISLNSVILENKDTHQPVLQIKKVLVFFSLPKSIWHFQPVPNGILVSGAELNVNQTANGGITLQGFPNLGGYNAIPYKQESDFKNILGWLALQPKIILENIDIRYKGMRGPKRFITLYDLSLTNLQNDHVILGKAILHQKISTEVTVALRWLGADLDLSTIKAKLYLYVSGLSLDQWLTGSTWNGWQVKHGILSTKIWANWHLGKFRKIQTIVQAYGLSLYSELNKKNHYIDRISGHLGWRENQKTKAQEFAGNDILIDFATHLWPVTQFLVSLKPDATGKLFLNKLNLGYLNLQDSTHLLFSSANTYLPEKIYEAIQKLNLSGDIEKLSLVNDSPQFNGQANLKLQFKRIAFDEYQHYPSLKNLSGSFNWKDNEGNLSLLSQQVELAYTPFYSHPIFIDELSGELLLSKAAQQETVLAQSLTPQSAPAKDVNWQVKIKSLALSNLDLKAKLEGLLSISQGKDIYSDLKASLSMPMTNRITYYFPFKIMDEDLAKWLKQAFLAGSIKSANMVLKGALKDFPFDQGGGLFQVLGQVENVNLHYADHWPMLTGIDGTISFQGKAMQIKASKANILAIPLTEVNATIEDLTTDKSSILYVKSAPIQTNFTQALIFVEQSPLQKILGRMFSGMQLTGPTALKLELTVPLKDPDNTKVQGELSLIDTELNLLPWRLQLTHLNGLLDFTENSTSAKHIFAKLFNKPITFDLTTLPIDKNSSIIEALGTIDLAVNDLEAWLKLPFSKFATGNTLVDVKIDLSLKKPPLVFLSSKLKGLALNLSEQFNKKAEDERPFNASIIAAEKEPLKIKLNYNNELSAALLLKTNKNQFNILAATLHIGKGEAVFPKENGLFITGDFANLNWEKIKSYLNNAGKKESIPELPLRGIDINIENLSLAKLKMTDLNIKATPDHNEWEIEINSPDILGKISFPDQLNRQGNITVRFEKLYLHLNDEKITTKPSFETFNLPAITFIATDASYDNMSYGAITFKTALNDSGQTIETLRIFSKDMDLSASGNWSQLKGNKTTLKGSLTSDKVNNMLARLGFDVHNYVLSNGSANFNLSWNDVPYSPNIADLNGSIHLRLGEGRIVEIGQASNAKMDLGRMLSLFSLQSLPRRLSFNFSDLYQKGYSFDKITGDFIFRNGSMFTSNLLLEGPVARVGVNGRIGLKNKDYDLIVSVTPYVTSTLPLFATLITAQPLIGLAALAVNSMIEVSSATTHYYAVKGPWSNPTWSTVHGEK